MVTTDTLISKINALASSIGNVIKTKLSKTEAATIYETKNSLKALAYKDTIAPTDLTDDTIAILKGEKGETGPQGPQGEVGPQGPKGDPGDGSDVDFSEIQAEIDNVRSEVLEAAAAATDGSNAVSSTPLSDVVRHAMGEWWFSIDGTIPAGGIAHLGQLCLRSVYNQFWIWCETQGNILTDDEWFAYANSHDGVCPYYSSGDGSTTFRTPRYSDAFLKIVETVASTRVYTKEGLPNIIGGPINTECGWPNSQPEGAVYITHSNDNAPDRGLNANTQFSFKYYNIDASRSNSIYGNSDHVTPKNIGMLVGVYAIGSIADVGTADAASLLTAIQQLESSKTNTDLSNLSVAGRETITNASIPRSQFIDITLPASGGQIIAPATGYVQLAALGATSLQLYNNSRFDFWDATVSNSDQAISVTIPCVKGDTVQCYYVMPTFRWYRCYPLIGAE